MLIVLGKSLIAKQKAIQIGEKERNEEDVGTKSQADPVFFISMVGVDQYGRGTLEEEEDEFIFDIFTKLYDFLGSNVQVKSAQDLWEFYEGRNKGADKLAVNVYELVEFFICHHPYGHYILDECPILKEGK